MEGLHFGVKTNLNFLIYKFFKLLMLGEKSMINSNLGKMQKFLKTLKTKFLTKF